MDIYKESINTLASVMAAKTDDVIKEAITRFYGHDRWTRGELEGRCVNQQLPDGVETFCLDGVRLVELYPIEVDRSSSGGSVLINAGREHRFLV